MHIYHALGFRIVGGPLAECFDRVRHVISKALLTYAYPEMAEVYAGMLSRGPAKGRRLLVDSGAFTAHTLGRPMAVGAYADWLYQVCPRFASQVEALHYFNLDVVGNQEMSWHNQAYLEARGLQPVPVVTHGASDRDLDRALDYPLVGLGGLVRYYRDKTILRAWLDHVFARAAGRAAPGRFPRLHVLGITQRWIVERYPLYSADSATWATTTRYGKCPELFESGLCLPKVSAPGGAHLINSLALRLAVDAATELERRCTALWAERGVTFDA